MSETTYGDQSERVSKNITASPTSPPCESHLALKQKVTKMTSQFRGLFKPSSVEESIKKYRRELLQFKFKNDPVKQPNHYKKRIALTGKRNNENI